MTIDARLDGHTALITGASRGIGRAVAMRLAAHGAAVALNSSPRSVKELEALRERIVAAGGRAECHVGDMSDTAQRAGLIERISAALGPVDILINNAAMASFKPPSVIDLGRVRRMFELNVFAPLDLTQQALPAMRQRGWGRIVNISSDTSTQPAMPPPGPAAYVHALTMYGSSKAALERMTEGMAQELHGTGVHVNAMMPVKIAVTEGVADIVKQFAETHPDWLEPLEMMAEATYVLVAGAYTGLVAPSRRVLQMAQQPLHALDGRTVIGDGMTLGSAEAMA